MNRERLGVSWPSLFLGEFLTVARMASNEKLKGHHNAIRNLGNGEKRTGSPVAYWIVGGGDDCPGLERLAESYGVAAEVNFCCLLDARELAAAYQPCAVSVGPVSGEGFGIGYLEASICAKPVVGSTIGGAAEAVVDGVTGFCTNFSSDNQLVKAVAKLLTDRKLADPMGRAGRRRVLRGFSPTVFAGDVQRLFTTAEVGPRPTTSGRR